MERDQEKFYEDENQEQVVSPDLGQPASEEEVNDMMFFLETLRHLRSVIQLGKNVPLTNKKIIDAEMCLTMINDLERNLPDAVQYGMQMFSERERILGDAETAAMNRISSAEMRANTALEKAKSTAEQIVADAENEAHAILADAEDRADHMVEESEIVRQAREEARIIKNDARVEASELRLKANHDAYQLLASVEDELSEACKAVRRRRADLGDERE